MKTDTKIQETMEVLDRLGHAKAPDDLFARIQSKMDSRKETKVVSLPVLLRVAASVAILLAVNIYAWTAVESDTQSSEESIYETSYLFSY